VDYAEGRAPKVGALGDAGAVAEKPWMAIPNQTTGVAQFNQRFLATQLFSIRKLYHFPVSWIPAIPAGMTVIQSM
jgi:hypothetical protein